jgi:hypothetical protein
MQAVPDRFFLASTPCTGIVDAKTFHDDIPKRAKLLDQQGLSQRNPHIIDCQEAAAKVVQIKVLRLCDGGGMFTQAVEEAGFGFPICLPPALSPTFGDGFANIDR